LRVVPRRRKVTFDAHLVTILVAVSMRWLAGDAYDHS
jgi:hypothetical protein